MKSQEKALPERAPDCQNSTKKTNKQKYNLLIALAVLTIISLAVGLSLGLPKSQPQNIRGSANANSAYSNTADKGESPKKDINLEKTETDVDNVDVETGKKELDKENEGANLGNKIAEPESEVDLGNKEADPENEEVNLENKEADPENEEVNLENKEADPENEVVNLGNEEIDPENEEVNLGNEKVDLDNEEPNLGNEETKLENEEFDLENEKSDIETKIDVEIVNEEKGTKNEKNGNENEEGFNKIDLPISSTISAFRSGPFTLNISNFNQSSLLGYLESADSTCTDLRSDLTEAVKQYANRVITQNKNGWWHRNFYEVSATPLAFMSDVAPESTASAASKIDESENSYGTNNQVEGVDEADQVKSDGNFVYTAYGDILLVWNAETGEEIERIMLPSIETDDNNLYPFDDNVNQPLLSPRSFIVWQRPKPRIEALLLDSERNRLGLVISGYGSKSSYNILEGENATKFQLYDTSPLRSGGKLEFLGTTFFRGEYKNARSLGSSAYIVTMSGVDMNWHMGRYLERYYLGKEASENATAYVAAATEEAENRLDSVVNTLFESITTAITGGGVDCSGVVKVAQFGSSSDQESISDYSPYHTDILGSFAQVHRIDMSNPDISKPSNDGSPYSEGNIPSVSSAGTFFPSSYDVTIYASNATLFIATKGHKYANETRIYEEYTYILGFSIGSGTSHAIPKYFAEVPGHLLNSYSMDQHGDNLRVATTNSAQWGLDELGQYTQITYNSNQLIILSLVSAKNMEGSASVAVMSEVGKIDANKGIGLKDEKIYAIRFLGNVGFIVTFRQTDPFYTLDLSIPNNPRVIGELKVSGFSSYLHPIGPDNSLILAVGQEADEETGRILGVQISLFDVSKLDEPKLLHRHVIEKSTEQYSSSESLYDYHAFRYLPLSKALILPISLNDYDNDGVDDSMDGFSVFSVNEIYGINHMMDISHIHAVEKESFGCWYSERLPTRSLVFSGKLTTIKGHTVINTNLTSSKEIWTYNPDKNLDTGKEKCSPWWPR